MRKHLIWGLLAVSEAKSIIVMVGNMEPEKVGMVLEEE